MATAAAAYHDPEQRRDNVVDYIYGRHDPPVPEPEAWTTIKTDSYYRYYRASNGWYIKIGIYRNTRAYAYFTGPEGKLRWYGYAYQSGYVRERKYVYTPPPEQYVKFRVLDPDGQIHNGDSDDYMQATLWYPPPPDSTMNTKIPHSLGVGSGIYEVAWAPPFPAGTYKLTWTVRVDGVEVLKGWTLFDVAEGQFVQVLKTVQIPEA
jgi:hypothetical protein